MAKVFRAFRFDPQLYMSFKDLASKNSCTARGALERFMADAGKFGLIFPSAKNEPLRPKRVLCCLGSRMASYWVNLGGKEETRTRGRLLQPLPKVEDADLGMILKRS